MRTKTKRITVLATLSSVFFLSSIAWAVSCPIPDTGQTKCYDNDSEITCPDPGEPFYGQDAQHPCNPQSYTSLAGGIMVQDNVTGLVWENKTDDGSIHDKDNTYNWQDAQDVFIAALNNDNFGGYSDWRLPTINELSFIRNLDTYDPSINTDYFPNTMVSSDYWSSTTYTGYPYDAWVVDFNYGFINFNVKSYGNYYVRAVRSGQCGSLCPTETLCGEHSEEAELLRYFRDNVLSQTPEGRELIKLYYELSASIVKAMEEDEEFKAQVKEMIDGVLPLIK